ncbi:hypothetical protein EDC96DRAFT_479400 [Choanephora cucurbitarum]|nr:hypothetical protein EDC96DRAFT_479400 [Choanephora cucurbitarum]
MALFGGESNAQGGKPELRILCRSRSGYGLTKLEKMGCKIMEVDYMNEEKLQMALKDCSACLLVPEYSGNRLKEAECLLQCAKKMKVEHMTMMSYVGVDRMQERSESSEFHHMMEFHKIEKMVQECFQEKMHCIIRCAMFYQMFYYLAPQMQSENVMCLPVKKDAKWSGVDLNDICEGVYCLAKKQHERVRQHQQHQAGSSEEIFNKRMYNFMHQPMSTQQMTQEIAHGLNCKELHFKEISEDDFMKYMMKIKDDKNFQERPDEKNDFKKGKDGYWSFPLNKFITEHKIRCIMEYFRMANKGCLEQHHEDLQKVLERNPHSLKQYFEVNRDQFKRFK